MNAVRPPEPRLARSLQLHMRGDWGAANLHRICGWISQELAERAGPYTRTAIWNGRAFADSVHAVGRGEVDLAMVTPAAFARMGLTGAGPFNGERYPDLCALGVLPQNDRLVVALRRDLGIGSFGELRRARPALRVATSVHDGENFVGLARHEILTRSGVDVEGWGGSWVTYERPWEVLAAYRDGRADAVVYEAIMMPLWQELGAGMRFLEVEPDVLASIEQDLGLPAGELPAGYFPGSPALRTLDFSDFLVLTRADLADDLAYAIAWVLGETREVIERQYRHLPPDRSPLGYPLDPAAMARTPVPLHPGAARYYAYEAAARG
jgi:uncharacterized protein